MRPVIRSFTNQGDLSIDESGLSGENESLSSRLSDKNLGDFEDDNSADESDVMHLAQSREFGAMIQQQQQQLANMASLYHHRLNAPRLTARQQREEARIIGKSKITNL